MRRARKHATAAVAALAGPRPLDRGARRDTRRGWRKRPTVEPNSRRRRRVRRVFGLDGGLRRVARGRERLRSAGAAPADGVLVGDSRGSGALPRPVFAHLRDDDRQLAAGHSRRKRRPPPRPVRGSVVNRCGRWLGARGGGAVPTRTKGSAPRWWCRAPVSVTPVSLSSPAGDCYPRMGSLASPTYRETLNIMPSVVPMRQDPARSPLLGGSRPGPRLAPLERQTLACRPG